MLKSKIVLNLSYKNGEIKKSNQHSQESLCQYLVESQKYRVK